MNLIELLIKEYEMGGKFILAYAEAVPEERFVEQPSGLPNHPGWTLGHLAVTADMTLQVMGRESMLPEKYKGLFDYGTQPTDDPSMYPDKETLMKDYARVRKELLAVVEATPQKIFDLELPIEEVREYFPTIGHLITHVLSTHEGTHYGQLVCWCKAANIEKPQVM
ncbi:DinB family protein [Planctomycetota bacterium]|nr:DinB family protein [Planctomycetota bacterium]